jgi:hypothetical protein
VEVCGITENRLKSGRTGSVSQRRHRLNQLWLLQKPQGTDISSAARTLAVNLLQPETVGNQCRTSAMKNPMSNIAFGMTAGTLSKGNIRGVISYFECAGSNKAIEIFLKPSRRLP